MCVCEIVAHVPAVFDFLIPAVPRQDLFKLKETFFSLYRGSFSRRSRRVSCASEVKLRVNSDPRAVSPVVARTAGTAKVEATGTLRRSNVRTVVYVLVSYNRTIVIHWKSKIIRCWALYDYNTVIVIYCSRVSRDERRLPYRGTESGSTPTDSFFTRTRMRGTLDCYRWRVIDT